MTNITKYFTRQTKFKLFITVLFVLISVLLFSVVAHAVTEKNFLPVIMTIVPVLVALCTIYGGLKNSNERDVMATDKKVSELRDYTNKLHESRNELFDKVEELQDKYEKN